MLTLVDAVVVFGVAVVLPLALGGRWWPWGVAAVAVAVSLSLDEGIGAAILVLPWIGAATAEALRSITAGGSLGGPWSAHRAVNTLAAGYAGVAGVALAASRRGWELFGIGEPIVELTAVHYTYAGTASLVLALAAFERSRGAARRVGVGAIILTAAAPPIVAVGFTTGDALPQVGGAVLMTMGVWLTGTLHLQHALRPIGTAAARVLLGLSGVAIWVPMVFAIAWAAGQHWDVPVLSVPDMARWHGLPNALGFVLCGLAAGPAPSTLDAMVAAASRAAPTYDHIGSTLHPDQWPHRRPHIVERTLGHGRDAFDAAVRGLREWAPQRAIGASVHPPAAPIRDGTTLLVVLRAGPVRVIAPNRIVEVVDTDARFGFAYGTLPGHPERGEESFVVEMVDDGTVRGTVRVDAHAGTLAARLARPAVRRLQRLAVGRYLNSLVSRP